MDQHSLPRIDVIIPVKDGLPYVIHAIESVLDQFGVETHVIVVDDGSTDGTPDQVRQLNSSRVTVVSGHGHESTCAARNRGIAMSSAPYLTFLDADDLWPPQRSLRLLHSLKNPEQEIAVGYVQEFNGDLPPQGEDVEPSSKFPVALCVGGSLMTRAVIDRVGLFDESLRVGEFVDWLARARSLGIRERIVPTISLFRRVHERNTSRERRQDYATDVMTIIRRHHARQSSP